MGVIPERQQGSHAAVGHQPDIAAPAPVAAGRPAPGHVGLAPEGHAPRSPVASLDVEVALVDEIGHPARLKSPARPTATRSKLSAPDRRLGLMPTRLQAPQASAGQEQDRAAPRDPTDRDQDRAAPRDSTGQEQDWAASGDLTDRERGWAATMRSSTVGGVEVAHRDSRARVEPGPVLSRRDREELEAIGLRSGATRSDGAGRRVVEEAPDPNRTCFERDRDRILHTAAFRRLAGKTQVFVFPEDHQRTRLTHALEVAQVARSVARALRLNVALTEAIALGHDCGHGAGRARQRRRAQPLSSRVASTTRCGAQR